VVVGSGHESRVYATNGTTGWDSTVGAQVSTGRDLDIAIQGDGFIAVQGRDGREAYTRAGDLRVDPNGQLLNGSGLPVLGDGGPMSVPPNTSLTIAPDGTVSIVPLGQGPETTATVGRIKLVNAPKEQLESSNVNAAEAMVNMIELARNFELQVKAIRTAEDNGAASAQLLRV
jgi:flagellar basal-body rod protein FlgF